MNIGDGMEAISKKEKEVFHDLSLKEQNEIRRKYKKECYEDYRYSIKLYILYVILGIIALGGLTIIFVNYFLGLLIFTISFLMMIVNVYFLKLSNLNFFKFLKKNNYIYERKKGI